jgi:hypothetical protein
LALAVTMFITAVGVLCRETYRLGHTAGEQEILDAVEPILLHGPCGPSAQPIYTALPNTSRLLPLPDPSGVGNISGER